MFGVPPSGVPVWSGAGYRLKAELQTGLRLIAVSYGQFVFAQRGQDALRRDGQGADADADGIRNSVGDGGGGRNRGRFANADYTAFRHVEENDINLRHVGDTSELVSFKIRIQHDASVGIHHAFFVKRVTHAHDDAAIDLAFGGEFAHEQSGILHTDDFFDFDETGIRVHLDFGELHARRALGRKPLLPLAANDERIHAELFARVRPVGAFGIRHAGLLLQLLQRLGASVENRGGD